ncbi:MAG: response regulator [Saprospiraceae bacterium]
MPIRVLIYEDNETMRSGLIGLLALSAEYQVVGAFGNCSEVEKHLAELRPDVVLMDIEMPEVNGLEGIRRIRKIDSSLKIIVLTVFDDSKNVFDAVYAGANGYLLKKTVSKRIFEAIEEALAGGAPMSAAIASTVLKLLAGKKPEKDYLLTTREKEILASLVNGNSYKMIATELDISLETVKTHLKNVYDKLQVHSQTEAVSKALREKIV